MRYEITTIEQLIDELGGASKAAEWAGCGYTGIRNWMDRQYIPPSRHLRLILWLRARGKTFDPALFELTPRELALLFGQGAPHGGPNGAEAHAP